MTTLKAVVEGRRTCPGSHLVRVWTPLAFAVWLAASFGFVPSRVLAQPTRSDTSRPVAPGESFPGPLINVRAPASAGWRLTQSAAEGMTFGRRDPTTGNTHIAQVMAFPLPPFNTPQELLSIVRAGAEKDTPPDRFKGFEANNYQLTTERPYPCVRSRGTLEDLKARTPQGIVPLPLHVRSLHCQHPTKRSLGLLIGYSQRGGRPDPDLDSQAQSFIDGVQVP